MVLQVKPEEIKKLNETPSELFFSSLTVPATKRNYIASLKKILCEFLGQVLKGDSELINQQIAEYKKQKLENKKPYWDADFEVRINEFVRRAKADPDWAVSTLSTLAKKFNENMNDKSNPEFRSLGCVDNYFKIVKKLCDLNNVNLNWKGIYNNLPKTDEQKEDTRGYTRTEIQKMLEHCRNIMDRVIILLGASSGIRAGAFVLKWKSLKPIYFYKNKYLFEDYELTESVTKEGKFICGLIRVYTNTDSEYYAFITPECWKTIQEYKEKWIQDIGKEPKDEDPFFRKAGFAVRQLTKDGIEKRLLRVAKDANIRKPLKKDQRIHEIPLFNGLRRFFNKENKNSLSKNSTLASLILKETQMGHGSLIQLDKSYFKEHVEELIEEYLTAIPNLTISEALKKEAENLELTKKLSESEITNKEFQEMKARLDKIDRRDQLQKEYGRLQKLIEKSIKEKNEDWIELRLEQKLLEEELGEL